MRFFLLVLVIIVFSKNSYAQRTIDSVVVGKSILLSAEEKETIKKQNRAVEFSHTIYKQGDPSVASFLYNDFTVNTDPSKQKKPFLLNTTIQPIINVGGKRWFIKNYIHSFQMLPSLTIRILQNDPEQKDHSTPVRTPSLGVRLNYWFTHAKLWNDSLRNKIYFGVSVLHHSNGQDAYEFLQTKKTLSDSSINTQTGNFSEI